MNQVQFSQDKIEQGFSSEQQYNQQQIFTVQTVKQKLEVVQKEQIKFKIPPAQQIKDKRYSLHPDIVTGWQPKIQLPSPIPIIFQSPKYDNIIKCLLKKPLAKAKLCYLGPKYQNTYYAWYDKNFTFPYSHIKSPHNIKSSQRPFCGQHWEAEEGLQFDSFFQSGNLDSVVQVGQKEYDLFMRVDSNTRGHLQWFNFKIKNLLKDKVYKINICNFQKNKILYGRGQKPYVFSSQLNARQKTGWQQRGQNVVYEKKNCRTFKALGIESNKYCRLSFEISTNHENDQLQISYCIPYTFTQISDYLHKKLKQLQKSGREVLKMSKLCHSLGGLEVPLLIINQSHKKQAQQTAGLELPNIKKCVIICGRAHPGESNGSFMIQGFLDFICGQSKMAEFLRKHVIFKIVPMMNPDGVVLGNYRTGLSGRDFNRQYKDPDKQIFPEVYAFKKLVSQNKFIFKDNLNIFLDFHGHSVKKNTFAYGPQFPLINKFYYESRIFPKILGNITPMFRYYSCSFKISECKNSTARAILLKKLNIPLAYTIQTSNGFYFDYEKLKDVPFTDQKWKNMGEKVGHALHQYMDLVVKVQSIRHQKQKQKKVAKKDVLMRKAIKSVSHSKSNPKCQFILQKPSNNIILQGIQDQNIKNLFEQIRKAQEQKDKLKQDKKCSDDEISQGSSDGQGQQDDLSQKKKNKLFTCIRNKRFNKLDKCRISLKRTKTEDLVKQQQNQSFCQKQKQDKKVELESLNRMSQQISNKRSPYKISTKNEFVFNLMQSRNKATTPKVINFKFGSQFAPQKESQQKNNMLLSKVNFFDMSSPAARKDQMHSRNQSRFSDMIFRKTYISSSTKQRNRQGSQRVNIFTTTAYGTKGTNNGQNISRQPSPSPNNTTFHKYDPTNKKNRRFENQRIRRLMADNVVGT